MSGETIVNGLYFVILPLLLIVGVAMLATEAKDKARRVKAELDAHVKKYEKHLVMHNQISRSEEVDRACGGITEEKERAEPDPIAEIKQRCHDEAILNHRAGEPFDLILGRLLPKDVIGRYVVVMHKDPDATPSRMFLDKEEWLIVTAKDILERHCS